MKQKITLTDIQGRGEMLRLLESKYNSKIIMELRTTSTGKLYADYYLTKDDIFSNKKIAVFDQLQPQKSWYYKPISNALTLINNK